MSSVIEDYYDSDFEYGTPAIAAYWGALTGYRMEMNKKKLSMHIRQMDPSLRQKQLSLIQDQIIKLRELRQNMLQSDQEARMTMWQEYQETTRKQAELESEANKIAAQVDAERDVARMRYAERQFGERVLPANISRKIAQGPQNDASWVELQNEVMQSLAGSAENPRRTNALQDAVVNQELITAAGTAGQPGFNSSQKLLFKNWTGIDPSNPRGTMTRAQHKELKDGGFLYPDKYPAGHAQAGQPHPQAGQIMDPQRASTWWFNRNYAAYTPSELERQFGGGMKRPDQIQNVDSRGFYNGPPNTDTIDRQIRALEIQAGRLRDRAVIDDAKYDQLVTNFGGMNLALSPVALRPSALRYPTQRIIDLYDADPERAREVFTQLGSQEEAAETGSIWQKARRSVGLGPEMPEIETQLYDESLVAGEDPLDAAVRFELEAAGMDACLADMPDWASGVQRGRVAEFRAKAARMQEEDPDAFARRYPKARTAVAGDDLVVSLLSDQINPMMNAGMAGDDLAAIDTDEGAIEFYRRLGIQTDADGNPIGMSEEEAFAKADRAIEQQVDQWESGARALESWIENAESNLVQNMGLVDQDLLTEAKQALQNYKEVAFWKSAIEEYGGEDYGAAAEGSETYDAIYEQYGGNPGKILQEIGQKIQSSLRTEGSPGLSARDKATLRKTQNPRGMLLDQLGAVKDKIDANENPIEQAETLYQTVQDLGEGAGSIGQEIMAEIDRAKDPETFNRALFEHRVDELYNLLQGETAPTEIEDDVPDDDEPQRLFIEDEPVEEEKKEDPPVVPNTPVVDPEPVSEEIWGTPPEPEPEPKPEIIEQAPPTHQFVDRPPVVPDPAPERVPDVVDTPDVDDQDVVEDPVEGGGGRRRNRFGLKGDFSLPGFPRGERRPRGERGRLRRGERSEGTFGAVPRINRTEPNKGEYQRAGQWDTVDRIGRYKDVVRWDAKKDDPSLAGIGQNAGTLYRYYYEPSRGRPVLYRMDYVEPRGRYATIPFSLDRAVKVERGSEEYQTAIREIESAFEIEE